MTDHPLESIGPYRVIERLGRGGMGEVFRGFDARLDRPVALKRIRPGIGDPALALRRFRREARAAARLRHPAIVQVHDWMESEGEAWLVMELVEGEPLRELLQRESPLEPSRAAALTLGILEGLEVAHEAGIVHRDLKIDNIMISSASSSGRGRGEQPKILDFGLAKKTAADAEETQLSMEGKIVGTLSALAPEQVLGQEIDARTDLFALGCLLYELLTGVQPFVGRHAGETLNRICTVYQLPANERRPEIPASLSEFVDHLLEKDPRRRPASSSEAYDRLRDLSVFDQIDSLNTLSELNTLEEIRRPLTSRSEIGPISRLDNPGTGRDSPPGSGFSQRSFSVILLSLLALTAVGWYLTSRSPTASETIYVAVPETTTPDQSGEETELSAQAIHTALLQGLVDLQNVVPLDVDDATDRSQGTRALALELGAQEVLYSRVECSRAGCRAELRRLGGVDGHVIWAKGFSIEPNRLAETSQATLSHLSHAFPGFERREGAAVWHVEAQDYEAFLRLKGLFASRSHGFSIERLLQELRQLAETSSQFAAIPMLEAHALLQKFQVSRESTDLESAERALARARQLAPEDPQVLMLAARTARLAGKLDEAAGYLDEVRRLEPGDGQALLQRALLYERFGEEDKAEELAREAAAKQPSTGLLLNTSDLFIRRGEIDSARTYIEQALKRRPDSFGGLSRLAQLELVHGDLERAADLYATLVDRSPEEPELTNLGTAHLMLGHFDQAAEFFERVVHANPASPFATLNLADVENLRGSADRSRELYTKVVDLVTDDPEPERLASVKAQALAHLGLDQEAVATIQEALRQRPDHPWTAYEAALVHTLVEDRSSAIWHARRALELGIEPRWLTLPYFDPIRGAIEEAPRPTQSR